MTGAGKTREQLLAAKPSTEDPWMVLNPVIMVDGDGAITGSRLQLMGQDKRLSFSIRTAVIWPDVDGMPEKMAVKVTVNLDHVTFPAVGEARNLSEWRDGMEDSVLHLDSKKLKPEDYTNLVSEGFSYRIRVVVVAEDK